MNHAQKARELFLKGANCSQAVFAAFSDVTGMTESEACRLAAAFGGGFARQREVCGAVSGMTLVLGALYGYDDIADQRKKAEIYAKEQALCNRFREKYGTIICRELLQNRVAKIGTTPVPDARTEAYYKTRPRRKCDGMKKEQFLQWNLEQYGVAPDYPFENLEAAVLRHRDNRKWYALLMRVPREARRRGCA